ncbi:hypothetical protein GCM10022276_10930 [Sphingomonas limnosediminicola]|uniref:Secreted protein n=1 Tax=Sphingomonas limnosediminicola TaxID=940133 RepID=A0ABP7L217_9SPHN
MRAAFKLLILAMSAGAVVACHKAETPPQDQNIVIDDGNIPANADIETLPADESSGTTANELANGDDSADVNDLNASSNAD